MNKKLPIIQLTCALILIFLLIGCVEAGSNGVSVIKMNGGAYDYSKYTVGTDTATVSKEIGFTVAGNGGKFSYTASGPVSATSGDGNVTVSVDAMKLAISGKTSGSGTATANASVLATGTANAAGVNVFTIVESETSVDTGSKLGSAEAAASANGWAKSTAIYNGETLAASAEGATSAYGKVSSPKAYAESEGEILGEANYGTVNGLTIIDPFCEVESWVQGSGTAIASATANGAANAVLVAGDVWSVSASGNTAASGSSKNTGYFDVEAEVEALSDLQPTGNNIARTSIMADAYTQGYDRYAQATGTATVKSGIAAAQSVTGTSILVAESEGNASASSSIRSIGWARGNGRILAESAENGQFEGGDNFETLGYLLEVKGSLVDYTVLDGNAEISGDITGFTGSASGSAIGTGEATGLFSRIVQEDPEIVETLISTARAAGAVKSSSTVKNLGWADADAEIVSVNALDAVVSLQLRGGDMEPVNAKLPVNLEEVGLQQELDLDIAFYAPVFEASAIQQIVVAEGEASKDKAEANAQAEGLTSAEGFLTVTETGGGQEQYAADSRAEGIVTGIAQANMCTDPTSTSIIAEFDTWIGEDGGVNAALVGSASYANGKCGFTAADALGTAGNNEPTAQVTGSDAYASGSAKTMAQASNADSLALAGIVSAAYAGEEGQSLFGAKGSVVDASLVGSMAMSSGASGQAAAEASGITTATSGYNDEFEVFIGSMNTQVIGSAGSEVRVKNGVALDVAGLGSVGLVQLAQGGVGQDDYTTGASLILDVAYADAPKKTDVAEAAGVAEGYTEAKGGFEVNNLITERGYQKGDVYTFASGGVEDAVKAAWADPIAISAIGSVTSVNSEPVSSGGTDLVVDGSFLGSIAMAEGQSAKAVGEAAGATAAQGQLVYEYPAGEEFDTIELILNSTTFAGGVAHTSANAGGGMALSIAGDASMNVVYGGPESAVAGGGALPVQFGLDDLVGMVPQSKLLMTTLETEYVVADEYLPENAQFMKFLDLGMPGSGSDPGVIDGSLVGAASFVVGKGGAKSSIDGGSSTEGFFTVTLFSGEFNPVLVGLLSNATAGATVKSEVSSMKGMALAAGGAGSLDEVLWDYNTEGTPPTGELIEESLLGDIAFADGFGSKDTAWSKVSVSGETEANGVFADTLNYAAAGTEANGATTGYAKATYMDPLSISLIGSVCDIVANATAFPSSAPGTEFSIEDATFIVTLSTAEGKGTGIATGTAIGEGKVDHAVNLNWFPEPARIQDTEASTEGSFTSGVDVKNGIGIAAAGAQTEGEVAFELTDIGFLLFDNHFVNSDASMFAYTGGEGAVVKANAGFTDVEASVGTAEFIDVEEPPILYSGAFVGGDASSSIYVLNSEAESLAGAESVAVATHNNFLPDLASVQSAFGVQMQGTNGGSLTATADMSVSEVGSAAGSLGQTPTIAFVDLSDGGATAILQPKVNTAAVEGWNDNENYVFSPGGGVQIGGFGNVNTLVDPNFAYAFRYGRAQGSGGVPPEAVPADFIVLW